MIKRSFDVFFAILGLLVLLPILLLVALGIAATSKGGVFYRQERIGKNGRPFRIFKFRTMFTGADKKGLLTVGGRDPRVTPIGYYLRKSKMDELPQLINVLLGDMSLVGPRPEVAKYVALYSKSDREILTIRPGITDYASIAFRNENELLAGSPDPEKTYIHEIMPQKLALNKQYLGEMGLGNDLKIILKTLKII